VKMNVNREEKDGGQLPVTSEHGNEVWGSVLVEERRILKVRKQVGKKHKEFLTKTATETNLKVNIFTTDKES
jgi:hypothetical protein